MFPFYTPWKRQKTSDVYSTDIKYTVREVYCIALFALVFFQISLQYPILVQVIILFLYLFPRLWSF